MESLSPVPRFARRMGLIFDNFIPIHQVHSHCRKLNRCAMMCRTKQLDATLLFGPKPVCPAWSENQRL